ncbi:fork head domain-containing protein, partial [Chlamydoabsidia padenii]
MECNKQKTYSEDSITTTRIIPTGPLHIVPSWQPLDANDKPPYSYATLIAHAILSSEDRKLTLGDIYQWITQHYPFYTMNEHGWQNSIRHNLSLNKAFVRLQRTMTMNSGKGSFWTI